MHLFERRALGLDLSFSFTFTYARPSRARMRRTYQLRRVRATGGHGFGLSSAVSNYVVAAMFGEESHRSAEVGIFLQDPHDATKCAGLTQVIKFERSTLFGAFRGMIYGQREVFDDKFKTLSKSMAENKGWGGSMGSLTLFAYPDSAVHFLDDALGLQKCAVHTRRCKAVDAHLQEQPEELWRTSFVRARCRGHILQFPQLFYARGHGHGGSCRESYHL